MTFLAGTILVCQHSCTHPIPAGMQGTPSMQEHLKSLHGVHHSPHTPHPFLTLPIREHVPPLKHPHDPAAPPQGLLANRAALTPRGPCV